MIKQSYRPSDDDDDDPCNMSKAGLKSLVNNFDKPPLVFVSCEGEMFPVDEVNNFDDPCSMSKAGLKAMVNNFDEPPFVLVSREGEMFPVDEVSAKECGYLHLFIKHREFGTVNTKLPANILAKSVYFIQKYVEIKTHENNDINLRDFQSKFLKQNHSLRVDLLHAAFYLQIQSLLDLTSKAVVDMIIGKTRKQIRAILKLKNDITVQEMSDAYKYDSWAFCV